MLACMVNVKFAFMDKFFILSYFDNTNQVIQNTIQKFGQSSAIFKRSGVSRKHD